MSENKYLQLARQAKKENNSEDAKLAKNYGFKILLQEKIILFEKEN